MELNLNLQRLKHIKSGESVYDALLHLGGKATTTQLVKKIAKSLNEPEEFVRSDVKKVLRAAVINGYLVRHGAKYLLSRSSRTVHTDSGKRQLNSTSSLNKKETRYNTFPTWWNRFWNRFVTFRNQDSPPDSNISVEEQSSYNDLHTTGTAEINKLEQDTLIDSITSTETDVSQGSMSLNSESSTPSNESGRNVVSDLVSTISETEQNEPISSIPVKEHESDVSFKSIYSDYPLEDLERDISSINESKNRNYAID